MMVTVKVALPQPDRHQPQIVQMPAFEFHVQELTNLLSTCTYMHSLPTRTARHDPKRLTFISFKGDHSSAESVIVRA